MLCRPVADSSFLSYLQERIVVADGAMGTLLHARGIAADSCFEALNLSRPDQVRDVHEAYRRAGARLLETNTFAANGLQLAAAGLAGRVAEVNRQGARLAREAAGRGDVFVAGAVGPLGRGPAPLSADEDLSDVQRQALFREQISALVDGGVDLLLFETFPRLHELQLALAVGREFALPLVAQMTFIADGRTADGLDAAQLVRALRPLADVVGCNCGCGPHDMLQRVREMARVDLGPLSAFANSGFPQYVNGRHLYLATPAYFADRGHEMMTAGAALVGGCCGTTPDHIRALADRVAADRSLRVAVPLARVAERDAPPVETVVAAPIDSPLLNRADGHLPVTVELDPPRGLDCRAVVEGARQLADCGVDAISLAENPLARIRMGNLALAARIQDEVGIPVIAHVTCRDRSLIGLHSELMGAHLLGIRHVLAVTGDPVAVGGEAGSSNVFDLNSVGLLSLLNDLNHGRTSLGGDLGGVTRFCLGAAFNPNPRSLSGQLRKLEKKIAAGARFIQTQPVYSGAILERMRSALQDCPIPVLIGLLPLVSERNAEFLHNEVPGIELPDGVRQRMRGTSGAVGVAAGMAVMEELIEASRGWADGYYIMPPFGRVELALELVKRIRR
ncbi:MAG: bifunctional homocysteine S-methyltransferase/methylenetetrahydrofolate reductase [Desulfuromonadaceae bacterium]|nr:bifunctional homocysteine S-methyltransferase/methylenetetrahydrofolate reductase [Desulfuromonadaceae bacterium]